jgi:predicted nucleotidyltransferase
MSTQTLVSERLEVAPEALAAFCQRWHIAKLEVFGSIVRHDFRAESDVDFLVSFEPGGSPEGFDWFQIQKSWPNSSVARWTSWIAGLWNRAETSIAAITY